MTNFKKVLLSIPAVALSLTMVPVAQVQAADALAICQPGVPFAYPNGGADILWNPDQGTLGPLTNAEAIAAVDRSFDAWEDLPESSVTYLQGATLATDIDVTNYGPVFSPPAPNGLSEIVFDADGSIFEDLFGPDSGILGFAGPDFGDPATCELLEGSSFLNGPTFDDILAAEDIMVHEFGHYTNLGHVELNAQIVAFSEGGDDSGPSPDNTTFGAPSSFLNTEVITTMYPFYFGTPLVGTRTPHADDIASMANIYPDPTFSPSTGTITGTVRAPNGAPLSGVNVIARRLDASGTGGDGDVSFTDSVSTFSGAYTNNTDPSDPNVGIYTLSNLTPGAQYAVFVDVVTAAAGRFSNPVVTPLPGPEEYYNGAAESSDPTVDDPAAFVPVTVTAGSPVTDIDIIFNAPREGDPLPVGDDGSVQLFMPFDFCIHGQAFDSVFVNANGNLTFGAPEGFFLESVGGFLDGPPRIAALWDDLNPDAGGSVFFNKTANTFTVTWDGVPEFLATGANTFSIKLRENSNQCLAGRGDDDSSDDDSSDDRRGGPDVVVSYTSLTATDGLAGVTGGLAVTGGAEESIDLSAKSRDGRRKIKVNKSAAVFELFASGENDLDGLTLKYDKVGKAFKDKFEPNDSLERARKVSAPFDTTDTRRHYSSIDPEAADIDFYRFTAEAGKYIIAEVTRGQIDSVLGLWYCPATGNDDDSSDDNSSDDDSSDDHGGIKLDRCDTDTAVLLAANDDSNGLLSRVEGLLPVTGTYAIGVTFCCDFDFDGVDPGQGAPLDGGRYVLDVALLDGIPLPVGDETSVELSGFGFAFPYDGGAYDSVFINGNGHLTFGGLPGFLDFIPNIGDFEGGPPRAAGFWTDLNADAGGFVLANTDFATYLTIEYQGVPEWPNTGSNTFSITLYADGTIDYDYGTVSATSGIIGAAQGNGASSTAVDLSATGGGSISASPVEEFDAGNPYDLGDPDALTFTP